MPTNRALIIGINKYPYRGEDEQLNGCVNDAKLVGNVLVNKFNFDPANVVTLCDEQASVDEIMLAMDRLANVVEQDDVVVFHFSGHGSQCNIKTEYTNEGSGKDNYIIPYDDSEPTADGPVIWRDVRDHQFNEWLQRLAKKTPYTTLIFDACHSGTMTRGGGTAVSRGLPPDDRPSVRSAESAESRTDSASGHILEEKRGAGGWLALSENYVVISGCRDSQTSAEDFFVRDGQSIKHGLLTWYLTGALLDASPGTTYRDAFEQVCSGVVSQNPGQNPQIEGMVDRVLFGVTDIEPLRFIPVSEIDGNTLILDGGAAHGLRRGSRWGIYPPGAKQDDPSDSLGVLRISHVGAVSSIGELVETRGTVTEGARCVEIDSANAVERLSVNVSGLGVEGRAIFEPGITESRLLELAETPEVAQIYAALISTAFSGAEPETVDVSVNRPDSVDLPAWGFFDSTGGICMPLHSVSEPGVANLLVRNLETIARYRNILRLDNPATTLNVEFNLFKQHADGELILANGGNFEFSDGETLVLELINHETDREVFFSILWLSASGEISQCYPPGKASEELSPGKTIRIGHDKNKLSVSWDENYFADVGSESCKVVFSTRESDFSWLNQEGVRSVGQSASSIAAFDLAYRGSEPEVDGEDEQNGSGRESDPDWNAVNRSFIITRAPG